MPIPSRVQSPPRRRRSLGRAARSRTERWIRCGELMVVSPWASGRVLPRSLSMTEGLPQAIDESHSARCFDDFLDPLERPEDVFARNDQRRRDADDVFVSFFAEDPKLLQCLAVGSRRDIQFNPD